MGMRVITDCDDVNGVLFPSADTARPDPDSRVGLLYLLDVEGRVLAIFNQWHHVRYEASNS